MLIEASGWLPFFFFFPSYYFPLHDRAKDDAPVTTLITGLDRRHARRGRSGVRASEGATPRHLPFGLCHLASQAEPCIIHTLREGATYQRHPTPSLPARLTDVTGQWWEGVAWGGVW